MPERHDRLAVDGQRRGDEGALFQLDEKDDRVEHAAQRRPLGNLAVDRIELRTALCVGEHEDEALHIGVVEQVGACRLEPTE